MPPIQTISPWEETRGILGPQGLRDLAVYEKPADFFGALHSQRLETVSGAAISDHQGPGQLFEIDPGQKFIVGRIKKFVRGFDLFKR